MKKLKIAQVAPLWFAVPPKKYGGTERIVSFLTEGFHEKGHDVTLFASGDSKTKAKLVPFVKKGLMEMGMQWGHYWWNLLHYSDVFQKANQFDIIHCHWEMMGTYFQRFVKTPVIHTLHNTPTDKNPFWKVYDYFKNDANLAYISKSEKNKAKVKVKNSFVVYNGMDMDPFYFNPTPKDYFVWVARVSPEKGIETAIKIAKKAGVKLLMAGQIQPQREKYFKEKIKPHLNKNIRFLGELTLKELVDLYAGAKALLYPIDWEEPFGLVMTEAMACGTPVIAYNRGSVPEIVIHGKTGFVVKDVREAIAAVKKIDQIKREDCRERVLKNYTKEIMVNNYEKLYYKLLANKK
ncbi:glycosyl transferase [bacterium (Candidatus Gribaldobacteria) CG23_combo_of_CG06-09_8_20_14_all_37_87_8]|uniref:Glycosyl transferase n=2 Tax=Candidatus Gribaldobacteria TaxID=2798536 RepID=A0A2G9ZE00_9BACT|nr:MAG: hypothetical protein AUJ25_00215 [Parcubacteria group bacterium CG1_02_37_13]PIP31374.1 MAG: glycosyl transferase [bacterium (Candidatus Gribaldobacteria) CG23_combo_of_CG06-09_8_20_14_all_37_87_8]PIR90730.1 MAG: glycosyl transferase [bacterium (Candidatus Gribaldobacteria) CG10_big_fil_rev_8_21_14_0_10_37_21]